MDMSLPDPAQHFDAAARRAAVDVHADLSHAADELRGRVVAFWSSLPVPLELRDAVMDCGSLVQVADHLAATAAKLRAADAAGWRLLERVDGPHLSLWHLSWAAPPDAAAGMDVDQADDLIWLAERVTAIKAGAEPPSEF